MNFFNKNKLFIISLLLFAVIRIIYFYQYNNAPYTDVPAVDNQYHHEWAIGIITDKWNDYVKEIPSSPFFRAPLYPYFISCIYKITNFSIRSVFLVQLLLSFFTLLVYQQILKLLIGEKKKLFRIQLFFTIFYVLCGSLLYFEFQLLIPIFILFLDSLFLFLFMLYQKQKHTIYLVLSALCFGLSAIARPNILLFSPIIIFFIFKIERSKVQNIISKGLLFTTVVLIPILPVTLYNFNQSGEFSLIATQGGINFYIGNNKYSDGWSAVVPELVKNNWTYNEALEFAEKKSGKKLTTKEHSSFWYKRSLLEIKNNPIKWMKLVIKKCYLWHYYEEISNNKSLYFTADHFSILLKILLFVGMGIFTPFLIFYIYSRKKIDLKYCINNKQVNLLLLFYFVYSFSFILFFINSRYRQPVLPILILIAAISINYILEYFQNKTIQKRKKILFIGGSFVVIIFFNTNIFNLDFNTEAQDYYELGNAHYKLQNYDKALSNYFKANKINPNYPQLNLNIGSSFVQKKDYVKAIRYYNIERQVNYLGIEEADKNLKSIADYTLKKGNYYAKNKDYVKAEDNFRLSMSASKNYMNAFNLSMIYYTKNKLDSANKYLQQTISLKKDFKPAADILLKLRIARKK